MFTKGRPEKKEFKGKKGTRSKSKEGKKRRCFICGSEEHFKKKCPEYKKKKKQRDQNNHNGDADVALEGYESVDVLCVSEAPVKPDWVLDSGCSFHMCPIMEQFSYYEKIDGGQVLLDNNKACKVVGIDTVTLKLIDGVTRTLQGVRHVPELRRNLISLGMLNKQGFVCKDEGGVLKITKGSMVSMRGKLENGLYLLAGNVQKGVVATMTEGTDSHASLWHKRLEHMREGRLKELSKAEATRKR